MGYQGLPELTRDVFTHDGFLRSGDIGYINNVSTSTVTVRSRGGGGGDIGYINNVSTSTVTVRSGGGGHRLHVQLAGLNSSGDVVGTRPVGMVTC